MLSSPQSGCQRRYFTSMALFECADQIDIITDKGHLWGITFLNVEQTFDAVRYSPIICIQKG